MLQHHSVVLAILHCGINSVMEALYHSIPVICFQSAYEQFDVANRLESQGLGMWFIPSKVTTYDIDDSVNKINTCCYNNDYGITSRINNIYLSLACYVLTYLSNRSTFEMIIYNINEIK